MNVIRSDKVPSNVEDHNVWNDCWYDEERKLFVTHNKYFMEIPDAGDRPHQIQYTKETGDYGVIPLSNNLQTSSPRLYQILQTACSQVINLLRILCEVIGKNPKKGQKKDFLAYYKILNEHNLLSTMDVHIIKGKISFIHPFKIKNNEQTPKWWHEYNKTKHNLPEGFKHGNLENAINALAAVLCLHVILYYAIWPFAKDILLLSKWDRNGGVQFNDYEETHSVNVNPIESKLFISMFYYKTKNRKGQT